MPRTSAKSRERSSEEATAFALAHRVRVEILSALNEADLCASELARLLGQPQSTVQYHLQELLDSGAVEVTRTQRARNFEQRFYRARRAAEFDEDELADWPLEKRQTFYGLIIRNSSAEAMAALHSGTISEEPKSWLTWARFNVDAEGWRDMLEVLASTWSQLMEIEAESKARREETGEEPRTVIGNLQAYPRSRPGRSSYPDRS